MTYHETFLFAEDCSEDLKTDRKFEGWLIRRRSISRWDSESRESCETRWDREDILEIEFEWIIGFLSDLPGDTRCCWTDDDIDFLERISEVFSDKLSHITGSPIVRIIKS